MKIDKIKVNNYKSIGSICEVNLYNSSTILVGKSNVGKSNILEAVKVAFNDDVVNVGDRCSWIDTSDNDICIKIVFNIEAKDSDTLKGINESLHDKNQIILTKYFDGTRSISLIPEIQQPLQYIPTDDTLYRLSRLRIRIRKQIRNWKKAITDYDIRNKDKAIIRFRELEEWIDKKKMLMPQDTKEEEQQVLELFQAKVTNLRLTLNDSFYDEISLRDVKTGLTYLIPDISAFKKNIEYIEQDKTLFDNDELIAILPKLIFIDSNQNFEIDDKIYFDDISKKSNHFMNQLLSISQAKFSDIKFGSSRVRRDALIVANKKLRNNLARYWKQENLNIEFRQDFEEVKVTEKDEGDVEKTINKPKRYLELDIIGDEGHRGSIEQQGPGFQWFFWFVVNHLIGIEESDDVILVMDEPALHLHAAAQYDLLDRFDNSPKNIQIFYTTHSPFMIDKNYPHRVLSVEKGKENDSIRGTRINPKPYHSQRGNAWEPIRSAIGLPAGASLFVGGNNLIVEGITDQIILSSVVRAIRKVNKTKKYDLNKISINFGGDEANTVALSLFCNQETENAKVLCDGDTAKSKIKKLTKGRFPTNQIFRIDKILNTSRKKYIDIEDLFPDDFYHQCFEEGYSTIPLR